MYKIISSLSLLVFAMGISSCTKPQKEGNSAKVEQRNLAVIIVSKPQIKSRIEFDNGIYVPSTSYLELGSNNYYDNKIEIKQGISDTVRFQIDSGFLEVFHVHDAFDYKKYYLESGDTIYINYNDTLSFASKASRSKLNYNLNYEALSKVQIFGSEVVPEMVLRYPLAFMDRSKDLRKEQSRVVSTAQERFSNGLEYEKYFLDSLKEAKIISKENYDHRTLNQEFNLFDFQLSYDSTRPDLGAINDFIKDSPHYYLKYKSFRDLLSSYVDFKFSKEIPMIKNKNGSYKDYREFYEKIESDEVLKFAHKEFLLYKTLEEIIRNFPNSDKDIFSSKFKKFSNDEKALAYLTTEYKIESSPTELVLEDENGKELNLDKVIMQNKSSLYYVDFWASWCKPCIEVLPDSKQLREKYKGKEITFVYLSIDEDKKKWLEAISKYKLTGNSYLVKNRFTAEILEEIKLQSIPRYILLNKSGEIIQVNAPDPSSAELIKIFEERL